MNVHVFSRCQAMKELYAWAAYIDRPTAESRVVARERSKIHQLVQMLSKDLVAMWYHHLSCRDCS